MLSNMLDIVVILLVGVAPPILSLWILHRTQDHYRRINSAVNVTPVTLSLKALPPADMTCIDGFGYVIGKVSCKYNARSPYIRCAINPSGPCQDCRHYESL
ncbi:DUF6464 family protein [Pseudanabaena galeata]|uniref:DUF6464 family protein n=2 Tax=Pseudanabaena TaxID=1152 RepID=UPI002478BB4D|nr:DUF6464 family protein [Pseudanabaena galeata]WGS72587.1 DUF6464 family protein [Pseudanabaena galeata CCNP1313]